MLIKWNNIKTRIISSVSIHKKNMRTNKMIVLLGWTLWIYKLAPVPQHCCIRLFYHQQCILIHRPRSILLTFPHPQPTRGHHRINQSLKFHSLLRSISLPASTMTTIAFPITAQNRITSRMSVVLVPTSGPLVPLRASTATLQMTMPGN